MFKAAKALDLPVKLHAEQLSNLGGAKLAARYNALSVDHIEYLDEEGVAAIAKSGTVAVLLPGAFYYLRETQAPPVACAPPAQGAHRHRDRSQPRLLTRPFPARHHEHGLRAFPPDARGSAPRRHHPCRPCPGPG